eukprot:305868-Rhodomonas_salina.2
MQGWPCAAFLDHGCAQPACASSHGVNNAFAPLYSLSNFPVRSRPPRTRSRFRLSSRQQKACVLQIMAKLQVVGVVGCTGTGKTTLCEALAGESEDTEM